MDHVHSHRCLSVLTTLVAGVPHGERRQQSGSHNVSNVLALEVTHTWLHKSPCLTGRGLHRTWILGGRGPWGPSWRLATLAASWLYCCPREMIFSQELYKYQCWDFPHSPVAKILCSQFRGPGSVPGQETRSNMLQQRLGTAKKQKNPKTKHIPELFPRAIQIWCWWKCPNVFLENSQQFLTSCLPQVGAGSVPQPSHHISAV